MDLSVKKTNFDLAFLFLPDIYTRKYYFIYKPNIHITIFCISYASKFKILCPTKHTYSPALLFTVETTTLTEPEPGEFSKIHICLPLTCKFTNLKYIYSLIAYLL